MSAVIAPPLAPRRRQSRQAYALPGKFAIAMLARHAELLTPPIRPFPRHDGRIPTLDRVVQIIQVSRGTYNTAQRSLGGGSMSSSSKSPIPCLLKAQRPRLVALGRVTSMWMAALARGVVPGIFYRPDGNKDVHRGRQNVRSRRSRKTLLQTFWVTSSLHRDRGSNVDGHSF